MKKIFVLLCAGLALSGFAQTERAGSIVSVKGRDVQVKNENADAPFMVGEKLHLLTGDKSVVLEVTFPMQTVSRCRLVSGSASKLRAGMIVYSGGLPSAGGESVSKDLTLPVKIDGEKVAAGKDVSITLPTAAFVLKDALVPKGGIDFPTGMENKEVARIEKGFLIAETETTFAQWKAVKKWAEAHGYSFGGNGENGQNKDYNAMSKSDLTRYPVTMVSWRDAIVWCNALTEYYNAAQKKETLDCVYYADASYTTPLRTSTSDKTITFSSEGSQDCPYVKAATKGNIGMANCIANGFRLPTSDEWEYAARYRGSDSTNTVQGYQNPYFTKGDSASGASGSYKDNMVTNAVAVFEKYDDDSKTGVTAMAKAKSKKANALGLYDVSGNVDEWCFDWYDGGGSLRVLRGGSWSSNAGTLLVGYRILINPYCEFNYIGFRFARTR